MAREWTKRDDSSSKAAQATRRYASKTEGFAGASWPERGSNDAANYGYGRQGADGYAGGYAPEPGSSDAANYGYGHEGADGIWGGYAPRAGSNDAANYGYGREGVDAATGGYAPDTASNDSVNYGYGRQGYDPFGDTPAEIQLKVIDDFATWVGADQVRPVEAEEVTTEGKPMRDDKSDEVRQILNGDWMVDSSNIDVAVSGDEAVLSGSVATIAQRSRAEHLVSEASGISTVRNEIRVDQRGMIA